MRALRVARWMVRTTRGPWLQVAVPRLTALAFVAVQLDAMVDWSATTRMLRARAPLEALVAAALVVLLTGTSERRAARRLLLGDRHAVIRRQPVSGSLFGPGVTALLSPLAVPAASLGLLWHGSWWGALLWGSATLCPTVAFAADRPLLGLGATLPAAVGVLLAQAVPAVLPLVGAVAAALGVPAAGKTFVRSEVVGLSPAGSLRRGLRGPVTALLHRDLLALWRMDRPTLLSALATAVPAGLVIHAMRVNGPFGDEATLTGAAIWLVLAGLIALQLPAAAALRTGHAQDPAHWPTTAVQRVGATGLLVAVGLFPTWLAVAALGHLPPLASLRLLLLGAALIGGASWWSAASPTRARHGSWLWWSGLCLAATLLPQAWPALVVLGVGPGLRAVALTERRRRST
ncbi:MAG: hypothetical protein KC621_24110 [Myxococcales bacterium]|nr:hypothetical protein [Myxococcales bacterium]